MWAGFRQWCRYGGIAGFMGERGSCGSLVSNVLKGNVRNCFLSFLFSILGLQKKNKIHNFHLV